MLLFSSTSTIVYIQSTSRCEQYTYKTDDFSLNCQSLTTLGFIIFIYLKMSRLGFRKEQIKLTGLPTYFNIIRVMNSYPIL